MPMTSELLAEAQRLADEIDDGETEARLRASVIRPLAAETEPAVTARKGRGSAGERLWRLAREATKLRAADATSNGLIEANAALQQLAVAADPEGAEKRLAELTQIQRHLPESIRSAADGPYLVTNAASLVRAG